MLMEQRVVVGAAIHISLFGQEGYRRLNGSWETWYLCQAELELVKGQFVNVCCSCYAHVLGTCVWSGCKISWHRPSGDISMKPWAHAKGQSEAFQASNIRSYKCGGIYTCYYMHIQMLTHYMALYHNGAPIKRCFLCLSSQAASQYSSI